ncbi:hypothetical protein MYOV011v1_p0301 [Vibrio phage 6E35.1a]|nr:hypothetical protein MYOV011v1_p0301 [Vibrio phage 6E35.1a]
MKNQIVLTIQNAWCRRRAYRVLFEKPTFGEKRKARWEEECKEFWYVLGRLNAEFVDNCPEDCELVLTCARVPRNATQMYYVQYQKRTSK